LLPATAAAQAVNSCGPLENHYGPYDYRTERDGQLRIVERSHFDALVEALVRGIGSFYVQQDINYVLKTSPNHHRALLATIRLGDRMNTTQVPKMEYSIECFLERGLRFRPDDNVVRALYAQYLGKQLKRPEEGIALLEGGLKYVQDNPFSAYNFGLVYFELGDHEKALRQAHRAMALGFPRTELKDKLVQAGRWREPPPEAAAVAASGAASSAEAGGRP
jgi:hypothetical protein